MSKYIKILFLTFCVFALLAAKSGTSPVPENRSLNRKLKKAGIESLSNLSSIKISDSLRAVYAVSGSLLCNVNAQHKNKYIYVGRVNSCRAGGCSNPLINDEQNVVTPEYFEYCILFDARGVVNEVFVYNYQATHGYEITAKSWLKQFIGFDAEEQLEVNNQVDAISGATISVYALTNDVDLKTQLIKQLINDKDSMVMLQNPG